MSATLPKVTQANVLRLIKSNSKALREAKKVDPRQRFVILYPDSENAYVGMGLNLLGSKAAENVYRDANELLKKDLFRLCIDGPKSELLGSLENRHLASYVTSHAVMAKLSCDFSHIIPRCAAAGGVGVGFVNSLVLSGSMTFENGLDLVQRGAQAMERAAKVVPSGKVLIRLKPATRKHLVCQVAIDHCLKLGIPEPVAVCSVSKQIRAHVIEVSGHDEAIKYLEKEGTRLFGFRQINRVACSQEAFHTRMMQPARDFLELYLNQRLKEDPDYIKDPIDCSVYSSTQGTRCRFVKDIKKDLLNYPIYTLKIEQLLHRLFARSEKLAQPNTLVLWDNSLMKALSIVNRKAHDSAKLVKA